MAVSSNVRSGYDFVGKLRRIRDLAYRAIRLFLRTIYLSTVVTPLLVALPIVYLNKGLYKEWLEWCVFGVEMSGAAIVKLFQWASSRPDMFGSEFCNLFKKLQDETRPHSFRHTEKIMEEAFGDGWREVVNIDEKSSILGSGCIGQVYKGRMKETGATVAVKVLHPNVRNGIEADVDILRSCARVLDLVVPNAKWLNCPGMVEEFNGLLSEQLDLRVEANNLEQFRVNFKGDETVTFPELMMPAKANVMVMEFIDGDNLKDFLAKHVDKVDVKNRVCDNGIRVICKMIFDHNFVHGDIHPGNILFTKEESGVEPRMVLLDTGIAKRFTKHDHEILVGVLTSFINGSGVKAAEFLIKDSIESQDTPPVGVEGFTNVLDEMCEQAKRDHSFFDSVGNYVSTICNAAAEHKIMMNQGFVSIALAVRVMEGVALALNPEAAIWKIANGIILKAKAKSFLGKNVYDE